MYQDNSVLCALVVISIIASMVTIIHACAKAKVHTREGLEPFCSSKGLLYLCFMDALLIVPHEATKERAHE